MLRQPKNGGRSRRHSHRDLRLRRRTLPPLLVCGCSGSIKSTWSTDHLLRPSQPASPLARGRADTCDKTRAGLSQPRTKLVELRLPEDRAKLVLWDPQSHAPRVLAKTRLLWQRRRLPFVDLHLRLALRLSLTRAPRLVYNCLLTNPLRRKTEEQGLFQCPVQLARQDCKA